MDGIAVPTQQPFTPWPWDTDVNDCHAGHYYLRHWYDLCEGCWFSRVLKGCGDQTIRQSRDWSFGPPRRSGENPNLAVFSLHRDVFPNNKNCAGGFQASVNTMIGLLGTFDDR